MGQRWILVAGAAVAVAFGAISPAQATFKGANGRLVYQEQVGAHVQLVSANPDGTGRRQLTNFKDSDGTWGLWSPNGSQILFTRAWGPNKQRIYTMNADGTGLHELDRHIRLAAAWFPDGKHLLVLWNLRWTIVSITGAGPRPAGIPGTGGSPCILPDGRHVAMLASLGRQDGLVAIFVAEIGGGTHAVKRITPWQRIADKIDCSPDGTQIAFSKPDFGPPKSANVFVVHTDGTGLRQLTHESGGKVNDGLDSWSPDGRKIAFVSNRDGTYRIYTMNADGTGVRAVSSGAEAHIASWGTHS